MVLSRLMRANRFMVSKESIHIFQVLCAHSLSRADLRHARQQQLPFLLPAHLGFHSGDL